MTVIHHVYIVVNCVDPAKVVHRAGLTADSRWVTAAKRLGQCWQIELFK